MDDVQGRKIVQKHEQAKLRGRLWNFEDNLSAEGINFQFSSKPFIYLFYNPPINFSRRTHLGRSCIFCGFLAVFTELATSFLISEALARAKRFLLLFSRTNSKFSLNVCSSLGFSSVEIRSDKGYPPITVVGFVSRDQFYPMRPHRN